MSSNGPAAEPVVVVGGGLAGCMCALLLAQQGEQVLVIEHREDFRKQERKDQGEFGRLTNSVKRSINLALSHRGICALKAAGVFDKLQSTLIPMRGRLMHSVDGHTTFQAYGIGDQAIFSISRADLNRILLDELDQLQNAKILFDCKVKAVAKDGTVTYVQHGSEVRQSSRLTIGADGAFSQVRESIRRYSRMDFSMHYIPHGYKELTIPPANGDFAIANPSCLHIWPRSSFMLIALPNPDKSFTCTLFAPFDGEDGLNSVQTDEQIVAYFQKYFPDVIPLMPDLLNDFRSSPNSPLLTVRCSPWNYNSNLLIIGDAAHACVPFYGQGMNAAFEDALLLSEIWRAQHGNISLTVNQFNEERVAAGLALADLSLGNYKEMRHDTASKLFLTKKKIEACLHWLFPSAWIPQYTMVAFTRIPYDEAVRRAKRQEKILNTSLAVAGIGMLAGAIKGAAWIWKHRQAFTSGRPMQQ